MEKSKLGISITLFSALLYFLGASGSVLVAAIAAGYVLLVEDSDILKKTAVKALILTVFLALLISLIRYLATILSPVLYAINNTYFQNNVFDTTGTYYNKFLYYLIQYIPNSFYSIANIFEVIIPIIFGFRAYKQKDINFKWIDKILDKHFV